MDEFLFEHLVLILWRLHPGVGLQDHMTAAQRCPGASKQPFTWAATQ